MRDLRLEGGASDVATTAAPNLKQNATDGLARRIGVASPRQSNRRVLSPTLLVDGLAASEAMIVVASALVAKCAYLDLYRGIQSPNLPYVGLGLLLGLILYMVYRQFDLYGPEVLRAFSVNARKVVGGLLLSFLLLLGFMYLLKISDFYSRGWFLMWLPLSAIALITVRMVFLQHAKRLTTAGRLRRRAAICGAPAMAHQLREHLGESPVPRWMSSLSTRIRRLPNSDSQIAGGLDSSLQTRAMPPSIKSSSLYRRWKGIESGTPWNRSRCYRSMSNCARSPSRSVFRFSTAAR